MSWLVILPLTCAVFIALTWLLKAPRAGWEAIIAALMLGLAGYALQGQWSLAGAPAAPASPMRYPAATMIDQRQALSGRQPMSDQLLVTADAFVRHGEYADAVGLLRAGVARDPADCEAWLAMGNALVAHTEGMVSPAALYAFHRAAACEPAAPGPSYFTGMALAGSGHLPEARKVWADLLAHAPATAPWRADLTERMAQLDQLIAQARAEGALQ